MLKSSMTDRKAATSRSMNRYKCDDAVAGFTVWTAARRAEYRCAVRHTRRVAKMNLKNAVALGLV